MKTQIYLCGNDSEGVNETEVVPDDNSLDPLLDHYQSAAETVPYTETEPMYEDPNANYIETDLI